MVSRRRQWACLGVLGVCASSESCVMLRRVNERWFYELRRGFSWNLYIVGGREPMTCELSCESCGLDYFLPNQRFCIPTRDFRKGSSVRWQDQGKRSLCRNRVVSFDPVVPHYRACWVSFKVSLCPSLSSLFNQANPDGLALPPRNVLEDRVVFNLVVAVRLYLGCDAVQGILQGLFGRSICHPWLEFPSFSGV